MPSTAHEPPIVTDVFDYLMGDGFAMAREPATAHKEITSRTLELSASGAETTQYSAHGKSPREVWPGIEDDVRDLERLLR